MSLKRKAATSVTNTNDAKKQKANGNIASFFAAPKPMSTLASGSIHATDLHSVSAVKFNKEAWIESLTAEQRELLKLEIDTLDESWLKELKEEITATSFLDLKRFLKKEKNTGKTVFPPEQDIYSWSRHTPLNTVKAVILGQDPYHNNNQAHGLAFSVRPPTPSPPSLQNIYKALQRDYPTFTKPPNNTGLLTPWADRGVLLLNTCLTVRAHEANSHSNRGWEKFTQKVIDIVAKKRTMGVVFLAWGTPAGKRVAKVDRAKHHVLVSVHPSPLSASRGWFECGHFKRTNEWLVRRYGAESEIDWDLGGEKKNVNPPVAEKEVSKELFEMINVKKNEAEVVEAMKEVSRAAQTEEKAVPKSPEHMVSETLEERETVGERDTDGD